jgi:hypothetical protein
MTNVVEKPAADGKNAVPGLKEILARHWIPGLAAVIFLIGQWPILSVWWTEYWNDMDGYYSHGMLVPLMVAAMIWVNKSRLGKVRVGGSWVGLLLLLASIPLYVLGLLVKLQLLSGTASCCLYSALRLQCWDQRSHAS